MSDDDSLKDFLREAIQDHDAAASSAHEATIAMAGSGGTRELGALPGHEVESLIARGGMGAVYRARQHALEREVAVKVMTAEAESPEMAERFRQEALLLGKLAHPNIVPVYDIGADDEGRLFYTMKLVKGRTPQHILNALRAHTLASLLSVFRKVCDALAFAHSQGIIHRDLKPDNVMVGEFGEVLVMDWGLAKMLDEAGAARSDGILPSPMAGSHRSLEVAGASGPGMTLDGSVMGTPQHMSPEQARGLVDELDARSDIFSLGGILYAILTLRPTVEGATLDEVLDKVRTGNIASTSGYGATAGAGKKQTKGRVLEARKITPLPHIAGGKVPAALSAVVMKALTLGKARRYQTVAEFSADIEAYQGGFATKAEEAGLAKQLVLLIKRNKGIFTAAAAWLLVTAPGVWFVANLRAKERRAVAGEEAAIVEKEAARKSLAKAALNLAEAELRDGDGPAMQAALAEVPEDLRDSTWRYLLDRSDNSVARIETGGSTVASVAAHPLRPGVFAIASGEKVILMEVRTGVRLLDFAPGFPQKGTAQMKLAFSPDGERLAVGRNCWDGRHPARSGWSSALMDDSCFNRIPDLSRSGTRPPANPTGRKRI